MGFGEFKEGTTLNGYAIDYSLGAQRIRPMMLETLDIEIAKKGHTLKWTHIKFADVNKSQIPDEPGVYFFSVKLGCAGIDDHHIILYIGRAKVSLFNRYGDYIGERKSVDSKDRQSVVDMLKIYKGRLRFSYVCVEMHDTEHLEDCLIMGIDPPCNTSKMSFPAFGAKKE